MKLGIDGGNRNTKVATKEGVFSFDSCLGDARMRKLHSTYPDMMEGSYRGRAFFAGMLAEKESYYPRRSMGLSKAHEDMKLRVFIAIHRYSNEYENDIIVGQPIQRHTDEEKNRMKEMLEGEHTLILNGEKKTFNVRHVEIAAEGAGAYWAAPNEGEKVRIIDIGSGTINIATVENGFFIDRESDTLPFGTESHGNHTTAIASAILSHMTRICHKHDQIQLCGGAAELLLPFLQAEYPHSKTIYPTHFTRLKHPQFANAIGFYNLANMVYGDE